MPLKFDIDVNDKGQSKVTQLGKGVKNLEKQTSRFGETFAAVFGAQLLLKGLGAATKAVKDFVAAFGEVAKIGDDFDKMSKRIGVSTEVLSGFGFAAQLAGTDINALEPGFRRFARNLSDADEGLSTAVRGFETLGISIKDSDGTLKDLESVIFEAFKAMEGMEDETKRLAVAQELFGRGGAAIIPIVREGSEKIREQMEEAKRLGIVWSTESATSAAEFVDANTKLSEAFKALKRDTILPVMTKLTPVIETIASNMDIFRTAAFGVARGFSKLSDDIDVDQLFESEFIIRSMAKSAKVLGTVAIATAFTLKNLGEIARFTGLILQGEFRKANAVIDETAKTMEDGRAAIEEFQNSIDKIKSEKLEKLARDSKKVREELEKVAPTVPGAPADGGGPDPEAERLRFIAQARQEIFKGSQEGELTLLAEFEAEKRALFEEGSNAQTLIDEVVENKRLEIVKKFADKRKAVEGTAENVRQEQLANTLAVVSAVGAAFSNVVSVMGGSAEAQKAIAVAMATIDTFAAANAAYRSVVSVPIIGPSLAVTAAGAAILAGLANVKKIEAQNFAHGGPVIGPGGPQEDRISAQLSHGENVINAADVERFGGQQRIEDAKRDGSLTGAGSLTIKIDTVIGTDEWLRDSLLPALTSERDRL